MSNEDVDSRRRRFLTITTGLGVVGTGFAVAPFALSMAPSERAKAIGAPVEVDISKIKPGAMRTEEWRGKPVWILNRTPDMLKTLPQMDKRLVDPKSEVDTQQPAYAVNETRSIKPEILVLVGLCTHLNCSPLAKLKRGGSEGMEGDWLGGFFCPCHGSKFDLAGRVFKNVPAPTNMVVPPHTYLSDSRILIGVDKNKKSKKSKAKA